MKRIINAAMALALVGALTILFSHDSFAQQKGTGTGTAKKGMHFVDQDGDGVCDNFAAKGGAKNGTGVCDGTGPKGKGMGMKNGNGTGVCTGTGVCDGTGPKGKQAQGRGLQEPGRLREGQEGEGKLDNTGRRRIQQDERSKHNARLVRVIDRVCRRGAGAPRAPDERKRGGQ